MSATELEFPEAPQEQFSKSRERLDGTRDEARLLSSVGERLKRDGMTYLGSFASHIYKHPISGEFFFLSQSTDLRSIPEIIANEAIKEQGRALMIKYGHKPPRKVGEAKGLDT
jgi:hypothetical protein